MERRGIAWALDLAHFVVVLVGLTFLFIIASLVQTVLAISGATGTGGSFLSGFSWWWVPALVAVLFVYYLTLGVLGVLSVRKAMREAMEGDFEAASTRTRRLQDREPILRLLGVPGYVWKHARTAEAYAYYLRGAPSEALGIALEVSRDFRPSISRNAAIVAASSAADLGDSGAFERLSRHLSRARKRPGNRFAQGLLSSEGMALALQLELDEAAERAAILITADPENEHRGGLTVKGSVHLLRGELDSAAAAFRAAKSSPSLAADRPGSILFGQVLDTGLAEVLRLEGNLEGAAELGRRIAQSGPRHRTAEVCSVAYPALAAVASGDPEAGRTALIELAGIEDRHPLDPSLRARIALFRCRILRALGEPKRAALVLAPAISSPLACYRQEGLLELGESRNESGDPAGAAEAWGFAAEISKQSRAGREAAKRLGESQSSGASPLPSGGG